MARQRTKRKRAIRHPRRRGIVLLIIISVLVLFMLMLVTFAVVSGHYRDAARAFAYRRALATSDSKVELESVLVQLLADPASPHSALYGHGFLRDTYGDSVRGTVLDTSNGAPGNPTPEASGAFCAFYGNHVSAQFKNVEGYYAGCVLTMISGKCAGLSTRVMLYRPFDVDTSTDPAFFRVEAFENGQTPAKGDVFIVNGKPFNGTGLGSHGDGTYRNDAVDGNGRPLALMPHLAGYQNRTLAQQALSGGADEPWDAFDYQNMFLTAVEVDANGNPTAIYPAFHRPDLINYWDQQIKATDGATATILDPTNPTYKDLLRQIMFRPLGGANSDHPNFDGSNAGFNPFPGTFTATTWDVDNDGDGYNDSIWIDPGLPIATAPDGRKYKRLVAIMVRDLDSRVNVNAHGTSEFAKAFARPETPVSGPLAGNGVGTALGNVPRGLGYGPAEINFLNLFQLGGETSAVAAASYTRLLQGTDGSTGQAIPGRYGLDGAITNGTMNAMLNRRPGLAGPTNTVAVSNDPLSVIKTQGFGLTYAAGVFSNYASPSDVWGRGAFALDYTGQPYPFYQGQNTDWLGDGTQQTVEINDNPYEINLLTPSSSIDTPYTVAELERVLRHNDPDVNGLPDRLSSALQNNARRANVVSTLSSHIPAPRGAVPAYMRKDASYGTVGASILEIARARIVKETGGSLSESAVQSVLKQTMPFEFFKGQMFDLNRPFGNGVDDNGNGVVDEPGETDNTNVASQEQAWTSGSYSIAAPNGSAYPLNGMENNWFTPAASFPGPPSPPYDTLYTNYLQRDPHLYARQLYARNIYCMLRLLCDPAFFGSHNEAGLSATDQARLYYRRLAQYAINLVDARDPDAIMTPFEYDLNPWDGWNVDGFLATDENANLAAGGEIRDVVWGMEQPELLITETTSFHNRRVADTINDSTGKRSKDEAAPQDPDQMRIPEGSTFIELYCPRARATNNPKVPYELYNAANQLDLARMAPGGRPVWQLAISDYHDDADGTQALAGSRLETFGPQPHTGDMTMPLNLAVPFVKTADPMPTLTLQRFVWFGGTQPAPATGLANNTFYNSSGWNAVLEPGQYMVVGPRTTTILGSMEDPNPGDAEHPIDPSPQQILLPNETTVTITGADNVVTSETVGTNIRQPRALVVDMRQPDASVTALDGTTWSKARRIGLNVTEPLPQSGNYYPEPTYANDAYDDLTMATNLFPDQPFDSEMGMPLEKNNMIATGSYRDRHTVVLQRLANPTQAYDPFFNPYINVDWASMDVTVFRGDDDLSNPDEKDDPSAPRDVHFGTRMRGNADNAPNGELWSPLTQQWDSARHKARLGGADGTGMYFKQSLAHTLGYVNSHRDIATGNPWGLAEPLPGATYGPAYAGEPSVPFPWIGCLNRPYANPLELLAIPATGPEQFNHIFDHQNSSTPGPLPYQPASLGGYDGHFRHLLPFFMSKDYSSGTAPTGADLHRLFDFVETPSPYVGTEEWYRPDQTASGTAGEGYRAPFNKLSRFRDPGRVNINTITDPLVWDAIVATYPELQSSSGTNFYADLIRSRRGYDTSSTSIFQMQNDRPSVISNPFRPADAYELVPFSGAVGPIDATLLRPRLASMYPPTPPRPQPLFENSAHHYVNQPNDAYRATDRNAYFRYQAYAKLANMLTTNSNTFAVWETIGYFEVEPNPSGVDIAHPDGYQLGAEMRFEDGGVRRPRAFYIIDRSIPAAFEPGQAHNVERCVLQRRYLE